MANIYKLSFTAKEIDEKLGKIDSLVSTINGISPDENGNVQINISGDGVGGGINDDAKTLLINILRNGVFSTNQTSNITALEAALTGSSSTSSYMVVNNLTNVTTSNTTTSIADGDSYTATLTPVDGAVIDSVMVTMGGVDITSIAYVNGVITIDSVTGSIVITAIADVVSATVYVQDGLLHEFTSISAKKTIDGGQSIFNSSEDFSVFVAAKKTDTMTNHSHQWIGLQTGTNDFCLRRNWDGAISMRAFEAEDTSASVDNNKTFQCPSGVDIDGMIYVWAIKNNGTINVYVNDVKVGYISQVDPMIFNGALIINNNSQPIPKMLIYNRALSTEECTQNYNSMVTEVGV